MSTLDKTIALLVTAMILIVTALAVLTLGDSQLNQFMDAGDQSSTDVGCHLQLEKYCDGDITLEDMNPVCRDRAKDYTC